MISERIKKMRLKERMTGVQLAEAVGVSQPYISGLERGTREPSRDVLIKLARALNTSVAYLIGETDMPISSNALLGQRTDADIVSNARPPFSEMLSVPLLSKFDAVCCGNGFSYENIQRDVEGMILISEEDLRGYPRGPSPIYAVYADGDSMEPNIENGERYIVNPNAEVGEGEIAFIRWKGRDLMRAVFSVRNGEKILRSTKPDRYKDIIISPEDMELEYFYIMGKVMLKVPRAEKVRGLI